MKNILAILGLLMTICTQAQTNYYIDHLSGKDSNNGTTIYTPLKTIERVNQLAFQPGDSLLFHCGGSWVGNLTPRGSGNQEKPVVVASYGNGPLPVLDARGVIATGEKASYTIRLFNQEYWELKDLKIRNYLPFEKPVAVISEGNNAFSNAVKMGIYVEGRDAEKLHHIHFSGLEICDVNGAMQTKDNGGIFMEITWNENLELRKPSSFEDIVMQNCYVHDVDRTGFSNMSVWWSRALTSKWGESLSDGKIHNWMPSQKIVIRNNKFERTGANALIVRVAESPLVEYNLFKKCAIKGSGNASFPFNCDNALFQFNEACETVYNTEADSWDGKKDADAGGFDSDWNCKNTIIQYNYSHDNGFGGVLICCGGTNKNSFNHGTVLRYNVFENNGDHAIRSSGPSTNSKVYNNLFYSGGTQDSVMLIYHKSWGGYSDSTLYQNNIFVALGKGCYVNMGKSTQNIFHANLFYGSIANRPSDAQIITSNPRFVGGETMKGANPVLGFMLQKGSPAIGSGMAVETNGGYDLTGKVPGIKPSRGPLEYR